MNSRERIKKIVSGEKTDRCGFWLGCPHRETWPILHKYFGTSTKEELLLKLNDDVRWFMPTDNVYKHPENKPIFDMQRKGEELSAAGYFENCESLQEVEDFSWPNTDFLDLDDFIENIKCSGDIFRLSGFWSSFFHNVANFFGMENYFIKMYTHPEIVHAVTKHTVDFYLKATEKLFEQSGDLIDGFFFGNDFGTQKSLIVSPASFKEFIFPYFHQLTELGKKHNKKIFLHSCGAIHDVINDLIGMGVDALHPLQAKALNMDAETLRRDFKGRVTFMGGIDTQELLITATPSQIKDEVRRVKDLLGPQVIISPSHEAILPNVPPQNIAAMAEAAMESYQ